MNELALLSVFVAGLLAGTHCAGMCGGIVGALSVSGRADGRPSLARLITFNAGRVASYTLAGALVGSAATAGIFLLDAQPVRQALSFAANVMLIALGLYLAGISRAITWLEPAGGVLWRRIAPLTRRFLPVRSNRQAFALGSLWGWLPCGLVYSILIAAFASASPIDGAALMLAFGLGTVPNLIVLGYFAERVKPWLQNRKVRLAAGSIIAAFGAAGLFRVVEAAHRLHDSPLACLTG